GRTGSPTPQGAGRAFTATVQSTDSWWNPLPSADNVRITSSDPAANTPLTGALAGGTRQFSVTLGTVATQPLTGSDLTAGAIQGMASAGIQVVPNALDHFVVANIPSPQAAGAPVSVTIRAVDTNGNTVAFSGDGLLLPNTGAGSITPNVVTFAGGVWSGSIVFWSAAASVAFTCSDYSVPPHSGGR